MKIKTRVSTYDKVMAMPRQEKKKPVRPNIVFRTLIRALSAPDLVKTKFTYTTERMELAGNGPWLVLMNHSSFIDLEIASKILYPKPYGIVCTSDGFVGKDLLMRLIGCIPTNKFVTDVTLIGDIKHALFEKKMSVLMYPEASYSFDGCATPLPRKMGVVLKRLGVPVVTIMTKGAFLRDPLYNCLQKRDVKVSANVKCLLTPEELRAKSTKEIDGILDKEFSFDNFAWQIENRIRIDEPFRADGLNRILYKCASCGAEGETEGKGTEFFCRKCGKTYELSEYGRLMAEDGDSVFSHIPDWYGWERQQIVKEIEAETYCLDTNVKIGMMVNHKAVYMVGEGHLHHDRNGFTLTGCGGKLNYTQPAGACYSLYADYFWYEIDDVICIGDNDVLYYCFPEKRDVVAKTRMAAEELYKMAKSRPAAKAE